MKYKAIIFDMDGTIIDSSDIWDKATHEFIANKGITLRPEEHAELRKELHGLQMDKSCKLIKDTIGLHEELHHLIDEQTKIASRLFEKEVKFIDGFLDFYSKVTQQNIKRALATNADDHTLHISKKTLGLENLFGKHIYNVTHVGNKGKPDPALFLYAAKQLEVDPEYCIVFEDSTHGVKAAKSAGMFCIGVNFENNADHVKESDHVIDGYHKVDLSDLLLRKKG